MTDLAEFLLARIAEDEAAAKDACDLPLRGDHDQWWRAGSTEVTAGPYDVGHMATAGTASLVARFDPSRVLAECEAKRRLVETFRPIDSVRYNDPEILRRVALIYADHPDYRDEWRP